MNYQFRLTFSHPRPGFFPFAEASKVIQIGEGQELQLVARDTEVLMDATRFHFAMEGFPDETAATAQGHQLRTRLQILNAALNLGLVIPTDDTTSARLVDEVRRRSYEEQGITILDSIVGIGAFPADGKHREFVVAGEIRNAASDPEFVLKSLGTIWSNEYQFNEGQIDALEILGRATAEVSPRTRFLLCYLALQRMVKAGDRSNAAKELLQTFIQQAEDKLPTDEATSLVGALKSMNTNSFPSALRLLAKRIESPKEIGGRPVEKFFAECVQTRNKIAHDASPKDTVTLTALANELRQVVLMLIWTDSKLPPVSFAVPQSQLEVTKMQIRIL